MLKKAQILIFLLTLSCALQAQSPHGKGFKMDCAKCHESGSWDFSSKNTFEHATTGFLLDGEHRNINCNACHIKSDFVNTSADCKSCHADMHNQTVGNDCARCHTTKSWIVENISSLHEQTSFPLVGVHKTVDCNQCHVTDTKLRFNPIGQTCIDCHNKDFNKTVNPNHVKLNMSTDCSACHNTLTKDDWATSTFPNHDEFYPLTGGHAAIAQDCEKCHIGGNFNNTPTECEACHKVDFNKTLNPNHVKLNFSTDCVSCHTTTPGWAPAQFPIHDQFYPLTGAHQTISNNCVECHKGGNYENTPNECASCHTANYQATQNPNHATIGFSTDCVACHTTSPGWTPALFTDHDVFYPITGAHKSLSCNECHIGGKYSNTTNDCNSCHNSNYTATKNPDHALFGMSTDCASCHTTNPGWRPSTFDHSNFYPLTGAHANIAGDCAKCHQGGVANTPTDCYSCHTNDYTSAKNPDHANLGMSTDCAGCHTTNPGWSPTSFDHNRFFPLTGGHAIVASDCNKCHNGSNYKNPPTDCNSCHNANYQSAASPNHVTLGLSTDCISCHTTDPGWRPSTFNHDNYYQLTGAHAAIATNCVQCHTAGVTNTPNDCNSCHNANYQSAANPNHNTLGFSTDCASCHTTNPGWRPSTFNHDNYYQLTGAHASVASNCVQCHAAGVANTPTDCNSCHNANYKASVNPNHNTLGFSTDCASCHTTNPGWRPSTFNHDNYYQLTGAHAAVANNCVQCHAGGVTNTPTDCNSCHSAAFESATNPNHAASGFSRDCAFCHSTTPGWRPSTFNHNNVYPLTGAHANIASSCTSCHVGGNFNNTPTDCNSCHSGAYNSASNPNHAASGFSRDCASCHTTNPGWRPSTFNHNNFYPLTGAHANIASSCTSCHAGGNFNNTPTDCNSCHSGAYNSASNPNHASSGFSRDCASCHTTNPGWRPSTFNHNNFYPLVGAHANIASSCTSCHAGGNFNNTPNTCYGCHSNKYNSASPNHASSGFSTNCTECHSQNAWKPASFNHDAQYFPIYSGKHKGKWNKCTDCHTSAGNYSMFSCFSCHGKSSTDKEHKNNKNYVYDSNACLSCHPQGRG
ncbi:hypothetical protein EGI22_05640 [Lacihabitans sp. LS3-19]|uniref:hypothetical protein n=1 Tax=Lacihabitans sp. LS3-19 TaxID=2487335 RepID=UPI0020CCB315|nr:hypothetical protein [Lacihabitans sp. LS3-19]MCP9767384.1 hypothetical protein [Lacihabitans sp. LS3-19]